MSFAPISDPMMHVTCAAFLLCLSSHSPFFQEKKEFHVVNGIGSLVVTANGPVVHTMHEICVAVSCVSNCRDNFFGEKIRWQTLHNT